MAHVGISVGIGSHLRWKELQIQMVMVLEGYRPGAPALFRPQIDFKMASKTQPLLKSLHLLNTLKLALSE
jgi:hypothetical protein